MVSDTAMQPTIKVGRFAGLSDDGISPLTSELKRLGFRVEESQYELGPQNVVEWALPPLVTLMLSGVTVLGGLTAKKYLDGFLEELGVKTLGSRTAKALKDIFDNGVRSEAAYYQRLSERVEPELDKASGHETSEGSAIAGYCPPLEIGLDLGANKITDPPWRLQFKFTRELGASFVDALALVPQIISEMEILRTRLIKDFVIKIQNPQRYRNRPLTRGSLVRELMQLVDMTCGTFIFDSPQRHWVHVDSSSGVWSPSVMLDDWFSSTAGPISDRI